MQTKVYSEEDIAKVVAFYNIHKYSKTYKQMASEYGISSASFYYLVKKANPAILNKKRSTVLSHIEKAKGKFDRCSIKSVACKFNIPRKQVEKWLIATGYEASMVGGFIFSTKYINKIVNMYKAGNSVFEIITVTTPISLQDVDAMQKLIDNNCTSTGIKLTNKVYTSEEIQGCVELVNSGASIRETAREKGIPESTIRGWVKKENKEPKIIEVPKEYMDGFVNKGNVNLTDTLEQAHKPIAFKAGKQLGGFKGFKTGRTIADEQHTTTTPQKDDGDLVTVLGDCVEHKTGDTIKTQPTLQIKLGDIEHKIAEHNIEIKKLEGYRDTLKQAILILNAGL